LRAWYFLLTAMMTKIAADTARLRRPKQATPS